MLFCAPGRLSDLTFLFWELVSTASLMIDSGFCARPSLRTTGFLCERVLARHGLSLGKGVTRTWDPAGTGSVSRLEDSPRARGAMAQLGIVLECPVSTSPPQQTPAANLVPSDTESPSHSW